MCYIITLTGDLGSGKGTVSKILKEEYGFKTYSTGDVHREIAKRYGMTDLELNKYSETHPEIDEEVDSCFTELAKSKENLIVDSRMAWHFIPKSFKVYLKVDVDIAASRVLSADRGSIEKYNDTEEAKIKLLQRKASENKRYNEKYGVDCSDMNNFNLVLDSSNRSPNEIVEMIMSEVEKYFKI